MRAVDLDVIMAPNPVDLLDDLLADLSPVYSTASQGPARFVYGPSGAFVLVSGDGDVRQAAYRAARLADVTRAALADHLAWVPFIDAVVVTDVAPNRRGARSHSEGVAVHATAVPLDLLAEMLVEGRSVVDESALACIHDLLDRQELSPWRAGLDNGAAKIDLCEPAADTSAKA